jgi:hypothetical protein
MADRLFSDKIYNCSNCKKSKVKQQDNYEWCCESCGKYYGTTLLSDWNQTNDNQINFISYKREENTSKIFKRLQHQPNSIPHEIFETIRNVVNSKPDPTWYEIATELRNLENHKVDDIYYAPSVIGFKWTFNTKWLDGIEFVKKNWTHNTTLNNVYVLKQVINHYEKSHSVANSNWVPLYLTQRRIRELDKSWKQFCDIYKWPFKPLRDAFIDFTGAEDQEFYVNSECYYKKIPNRSILIDNKKQKMFENDEQMLYDQGFEEVVHSDEDSDSDTQNQIQKTQPIQPLMTFDELLDLPIDSDIEI